MLSGYAMLLSILTPPLPQPDCFWMTEANLHIVRWIQYLQYHNYLRCVLLHKRFRRQNQSFQILSIGECLRSNPCLRPWILLLLKHHD